jgi:phage-related protein
MYEVKFYRDRNGKSEIVEYLDSLKEKGETSKTERINRDKILAYIGALERYGTRIGQPVVKHIDGSLWELRPIANRILFFYWKDNKFVLLHHFIKKTQKTPSREIEQAQAKMKDFIERHGDKYAR